MGRLNRTALLLGSALIGAMLLGACETAPDEGSPGTRVPNRPETGLPRIAQRDPEPAPLQSPQIKMVDFALLRVGMSKAEVRAIFPDPNEIETSTRGLEVWGYGFAELLFRDGLLENWFNLRDYPPRR